MAFFLPHFEHKIDPPFLKPTVYVTDVVFYESNILSIEESAEGNT